ncbi:MAG TPA: hypothetical protein VF077_03795 [Nitrospiraceae bacterium]
MKLVGMLGSSFDGERANAARMLENLARSQKLTIGELLAQVYSNSKPSSSPPPPPPSSPRYRYYDFDDDEGDDLGFDIINGMRDAVGNPYLTPWEVGFVDNLARNYRNDYELSERQRSVATRILNKLRSRR